MQLCSFDSRFFCSSVNCLCSFKQFNFLRDQVVSTWNINPWETEVAVGMFQGGMASFGAYAFRYANDAAFDEIFSLYATKTPHYTTNIAL